MNTQLASSLSQSRPNEGRQDNEEFDFTPHLNVLIKSDQNFRRIGDALAELIDNSIEACSAELSTYVRVSLHLNTKEQSGYVVVYDNGKGMNKQELIYFATHSMDHEARDVVNKLQGREATLRNDSNRRFISKFGVGAKQAGFHLGDCIRVITKRKVSGSTSTEAIPLDEVREATFDAKELAQNFADHGKAIYKSQFKLRDVMEAERYSSVDQINDFPDMLQEINEFEDTYRNNFTIMVIRLKEEHAKKMLKADKRHDVMVDIHNTYYFHLHPEHQIAQLKHDRRFTYAGSTDLRSSTINPNEATFQENPLEIQFFTFLKGCTPYPYCQNIIDVGTYFQSCFDFASAGLLFNFEIPDPKAELSNRNDKIVMDEKNAIQKHSVGVILLYFAFKDGAESKPTRGSTFPDVINSGGTVNEDFTVDGIKTTHPSPLLSSSLYSLSDATKNKTHLSTESTSSTVPNFALSISSEGNSTQTMSQLQRPKHNSARLTQHQPDEDEEDQQSKAYVGTEDVFNVFWQHRLVPDTTVQDLKIFPTKGQAEKDISDRWKYRLKGFLFLDRKFPHITNNKLQIQVDNFNNFLNSKEAIDYQLFPQRLNLPSWLRLVHEQHDEDYFLIERNFALEVERNRNISRKKSYFSGLKIGTGAANIVRVNDIIQLYEKPNKFSKQFRPSRESTRSGAITVNSEGHIIYARVIAFEAQKFLDSEVQKYNGNAKIVYQREPTKVFGAEDELGFKDVLFGKLAEFSQLVMTNNKIVKVDQKSLNSLEIQRPESVSVYLFSELGSEPMKIVDPSVRIIEGQVFWKLGLQILDCAKNQVFHLPQQQHPIRADKRLKVQVAVQSASDSGVRDHAFGELTGKHIYYYDENKKEDVELPGNYIDKGISLENAFYGIYGKLAQKRVAGFSFDQAGSFNLFVEVFDAVSSGDRRKLFEQTIPFKVYNEKRDWNDIASITVEPVERDGFKSPPPMLGSLIPTFKILFKDSNGEIVEFASQVKTSIIDLSGTLILGYARDGDPHVIASEEPLYELTAGDEEGNDNGVLIQDGWTIIAAKNAEPIDDCGFLIPKDYKFKCVVKKCLNKKICIGAELMTTFKMKMCSGTPYKLLLVSGLNENEEYINHQTIPSLSFHCVDYYGYRTTHAGRSATPTTWQIVFHPEGPIKATSTEVLQDGSAVLKNLIFEVSDKLLPSNGAIISQTVYLNTGSIIKEIPDDLSLNQLIEFDSVKLDLNVNLKPLTKTPAVAENGILHDRDPIRAGSVITQLTLCMKTDSDEELPFCTSWFVGDKTGFICSAVKPKKRLNLTSQSLPDLKIPELIPEDDQFEVDYTFYLFGLTRPISCSYCFKIVPDVPFSWALLTSPLWDEGLELSDVSIIDDIYVKVLGVILVDQYNNPINMQEYAQIVPQLLIEFVTDENDADDDDVNIAIENQSKRPRLRSKEYSPYYSFSLELKRNDENNKYILTSNQTITFKPPTPPINFVKAVLRVTEITQSLFATPPSPKSFGFSSAGHDIRDCVKKIHIASGLPCKFKLSSIAWDIIPNEAASNSYSVITEMYQRGEFILSLLDRNGHPASVQNVSIKGIKCGLMNMHGVLLSKKYFERKKITSSDLTIPFQFTNSIKEHNTNADGISIDTNTEVKVGSQQMHELQFQVSLILKDDVVSLDPLYLLCTLQPINRVHSILYTLINGGNLTQNKGDNLHFKTSACEIFPKSRLQFETEDCQNFVPNIEDVKITIGYSVELIETDSMDHTLFQKKHISDIFETITRLEDISCVEFIPREELHHKVGFYVIEFVYIEKREELKHIPKEDKKLSKKVVVEIEPGAISCLVLNETAKVELEGVVVSNVVNDSDTTSRTLGKNVMLHVCDEYGNKVKLPPESIITCHISKSEDGGNDSESTIFPSQWALMPRLTHSNEDGYLQADTSQYEAYFPHLQLEPNFGDASVQGSLSLVFSLTLPSTHPPLPRERTIVKVSFHFTTEDTILRDRKEIRNSLIAIQRALKTEQPEIVEIESRHKRLQERIQNLMNRTLFPGRSFGNELTVFGSTGYTQESFEHYKRGVEATLQAMDDIAEPRQVLKPNTKVCKAHSRAIGLYVDLGYCSDTNVARILSWANRYIDFNVVPNQKTSVEMYELGLKSIAVTVLFQFEIEETNPHGEKIKRHRNEAEMKRRKLPLHIPKGTEGNPHYLVNLVELPDDNEHMRDNIFWTAYRTDMLFDDLESAMNFMATQRKIGRRSGTIYTRSGIRIDPNGALDPTPGKGTIPDKFPFMYAELPSEEVIERRRLQQEVEVLNEIAERLNEQKSCGDELAKFRARVNELEAANKELRLLLGSLGMSMGSQAEELSELPTFQFNGTLVASSSFQTACMHTNFYKAAMPMSNVGDGSADNRSVADRMAEDDRSENMKGELFSHSKQRSGKKQRNG